MQGQTCQQLKEFRKYKGEKKNYLMVPLCTPKISMWHHWMNIGLSTNVSRNPMLIDGFPNGHNNFHNGKLGLLKNLFVGTFIIKCG